MAFFHSYLVQSTPDDDIAAGLDNCVGRTQLGPNLLAPNLVHFICEIVFWSHLVALGVNSGDQNLAIVVLIRSLPNLGRVYPGAD